VDCYNEKHKLVVDCYSEKHKLESVIRVMSVQGLDQEGECESRISSSQSLIQVRGGFWCCYFWVMVNMWVQRIQMCCTAYIGLGWWYKLIEHVWLRFGIGLGMFRMIVCMYKGKTLQVSPERVHLA